MSEPVAIGSIEQFRRMAAAVRWAENRMKTSEADTEATVPIGPVVCSVEVTNATASSGLYQGKFVHFNYETNAWYDVLVSPATSDCRVIGLNGDTLTTGVRYEGVVVGIRNASYNPTASPPPPPPGTNDGYPIVVVWSQGVSGRSPRVGRATEESPSTPLSLQFRHLSAGAWADGGTTTDTVYPVQVDGAAFEPRPQVTAGSPPVVTPGALMLVFPDENTPTRYAGIPIQYASKQGATYYGGFLSATTQDIGGAKVFWHGASAYVGLGVTPVVGGTSVGSTTANGVGWAVTSADGVERAVMRYDSGSPMFALRGDATSDPYAHVTCYATADGSETNGSVPRLSIEVAQITEAGGYAPWGHLLTERYGAAGSYQTNWVFKHAVTADRFIGGGGGLTGLAWAGIGGTPTTLAGYGITDAQPLDADLTAIAALTGTGTIYYRSGASAWSAVTIGTGLDFTAGTLSATGAGGILAVEDGGTGADMSVTGPGVVYQTGNGTNFAAYQTAAVADVSGTAGATYGATEQGMLNDLTAAVNAILAALRGSTLIDT